MHANRRQQILVDSEVQLGLLWRATKYWFFCLLTVAMFLICWAIVTTDNRGGLALLNYVSFQYGPAALASVLVLPLIYLDLLRESHRFAGPIVKLRGALREIAEGHPPREIDFREDDHWHELADEYNAAVVRLQADLAPRHQDERAAEVIPLYEDDLPPLRLEEPIEELVGSS